MNKISSSIAAGTALAFIAVIIWSGNFVASRGLSTLYSPSVIAFSRWFLAVMILFPFSIKHVLKDWPLIIKQKYIIIGCGLSGTGLYSILCYWAGQTSSATNLSLLASTSPVFTIMLMKILYKERISSKRIIGIIIAILGIVFLLIKGNLHSITDLNFSIGEFLILIATFLWSVYIILNKQKSPELSTQSFIFCVFLVALCVTIPFFFGHCVMFGFPVFEQTGIACFLYLAIGCCIVSFMLWSKAVTLIGPTNSSIIYNVIPVFSCLIAFIFLGEPILPVQIVAILIIFTGITLAQDLSDQK